jgi:REP element-mobilizing transposase RayT
MTKNLSIIWLHAILSTRDRQRILLKSFRYKLFRHIKDYAIDKGIQLDIINGVEDHVHCLFCLKPSQNPAEIIKLLKGESSFWINKNVILDDKFEWQVGYGVFSVSEKEIMAVRKYIYYQEEHHKELSYEEELKRIVKNRG